MLQAGFHDVPPGHVAMVVTHLEMTTKPALRGTTLPEGLSFTQLPRDPEAYKTLFRRIGEDWLWFGRLQMPETELTAILNDENTVLWTLLKNGTPEALLELDFRKPNQCELAYFGLTPNLVGTGAGAYLMDRAIELAWAQPITRLHVHTCTADSPQALPFYIRSGFTPTRREIEIAPDPRQTGLLPRTATAQLPQL